MGSDLDKPKLITIYPNSRFSKTPNSVYKTFNLGNRIPCDKVISFDDAILFKEVPNFQLFEILLYSNQKYVYGFKFVYFNPETKQYLSGVDLRTNDSDTPKDIIPKSIKFNENDCVVEITVRNGMIIDFIRFRTKKGLILEGGNPTGGEFVKTVKSRKDHYFSNFGGSIETSWRCLKTINFEEINLKQLIKCQTKISFQTYRHVLRLIVNYLPFKDSVKIFLLNSHLHSLRRDPLCFKSLTESVLKSLNNQHRMYIKDILEKELQMAEDGQTEDESFKYAMSLIRMTSNKIKNAYGDLGLQGWQMTGSYVTESKATQPYRTHCFAGSRYMSTIFQDLVLNEIFDEEFIEGFNKGTKVIFAGGNIARTTECPAVGFIQLQVFNESGEEIFNDKINKENLIPEYELICIRYKVEEGKIPYKLKFTAGGYDRKTWSGDYYGPKFSGLFVRGYDSDFLVKIK